jgi:hypothetical protein
MDDGGLGLEVEDENKHQLNCQPIIIDILLPKKIQTALPNVILVVGS